VSQRKLTINEIKSLQEAFVSDIRKANIRLREGEYQFTLAEGIADLQLNLTFPDVRDVIRKTSGDKDIQDIQIIRKIQTILKKMEKGNVVRILPKKKPWELQRYMLLGFRFQDAENNTVVLATDQQIKQSQDLLQSTMKQQDASLEARNLSLIKVGAFGSVLLASYITILWSLVQPVISSVVFILAFCAAGVAAVALGRALTR